MPKIFKPTMQERIILLPSGREVCVAKATPRFPRWMGEPPPDTFGNKPIVDFAGEMVFAELWILRAFERAGWDGRWVDGYGGRTKFRIGFWGENGERSLPPDQKAIFESIRSEVGRSGGCFDLFCWKGPSNMFVESKWRGRDRIRETQKRWLEAALQLHPLDSFLVVEWDFETKKG